jgi:hypothetical protein
MQTGICPARIQTWRAMHAGPTGREPCFSSPGIAHVFWIHQSRESVSFTLRTTHRAAASGILQQTLLSRSTTVSPGLCPSPLAYERPEACTLPQSWLLPSLGRACSRPSSSCSWLAAAAVQVWKTGENALTAEQRRRGSLPLALLTRYHWDLGAIHPELLVSKGFPWHSNYSCSYLDGTCRTW